MNYIELSEFIEQLNLNDFSSVIDNKKYLIRFFNVIKNTIPNEINKPEIKSRLTVIETDFLRFEALISNYEINDKMKSKMVKKINNSFSNLNYQIDKLTEKREFWEKVPNKDFNQKKISIYFSRLKSSCN